MTYMLKIIIGIIVWIALDLLILMFFKGADINGHKEEV